MTAEEMKAELKRYGVTQEQFARMIGVPLWRIEHFASSRIELDRLEMMAVEAGIAALPYKTLAEIAALSEEKVAA